MTIYLVLPAYNESESLVPLLDKAATAAGSLSAPFKVIVVDDGSSDGTASVAMSHPLAARGMLETIPHRVNQGLAAAVRTGIEAFLSRSDSDDDIMVTMDADDTHDPKYIEGLQKAVSAGADVAICSRFAEGGVEVGVNAFRKLLSRGAKVFMDLIAPVSGVKDISCGYRAYAKPALEKALRVYGERIIQTIGGSVQAELLVKLQALGAKVVEIPFTLRYDLKRGPSKLRMTTTIMGYFKLRGIKRAAVLEAKLRSAVVSSPPDASKTLVLTCTYNEADNIERLIGRIFYFLPGASVLVVDDSSPDGTGRIVEKLKMKYEKLHLITRPGKLGLATAISSGVKWAIENGYERVINMDADFSHDPAVLPDFVSKAFVADYVIGSRYVRGGGTVNWGLHRKILSRGANLFARFMTGAPVRDLTTGYRLISLARAPELCLDDIEAKGYGYLTAMTCRAAAMGLRIVETPIIFLDRSRGESKMDTNIIKEAVLLVFRLRKECRACRRTNG
ncbi:MAG TPA: glycosyltransferase [bacterium]|nr:glycosyltransferase [bacterium]